MSFNACGEGWDPNLHVQQSCSTLHNLSPNLVDLLVIDLLPLLDLVASVAPLQLLQRLKLDCRVYEVARERSCLQSRPKRLVCHLLQLHQERKQSQLQRLKPSRQ